MTDRSQLRDLILSLDGVHTVYPADPAWKTTARRIRAALDPEAGDASPEYIRLSTEGTSTTASVRVGADGTVPAAELARSVAAALRAELDGGHPRGTVNLAVEISSIRHVPALPGTGPTP